MSDPPGNSPRAHAQWVRPRTHAKICSDRCSPLAQAKQSPTRLAHDDFPTAKTNYSARTHRICILDSLPSSHMYHEMNATHLDMVDIAFAVMPLRGSCCYGDCIVTFPSACCRNTTSAEPPPRQGTRKHKGNSSAFDYSRLHFRVRTMSYKLESPSSFSHINFFFQHSMPNCILLSIQ